jgi:hypothetical protein
MKMPTGLVIQDPKVRNYLLVYQEKDDKSGYLALGGYTLENWRLLKRDILNAVEGSEVSEIIQTDWGIRFKVRNQWSGLNSYPFKIVTIWQQDEGSERIRFVTLYPDRSQED